MSVFPKNKDRMHIDDYLDHPLKYVLERIQDRILKETYWFGVKTLKNPMDAWCYQEIVHEVRPDVIVEIGTRFGGSALCLAHLSDIAGKGRVISVDLNHSDVADAVRRHPRIELIEADAKAAFDEVSEKIHCDETVMVIEDSSHTYENTLDVLRTYSPIVSPGSYFIVEDTIVNHGLDFEHLSPGPFEAVESFLAENREFEADLSRESFLITWNPKGYLRRKTKSDMESS